MTDSNTSEPISYDDYFLTIAHVISQRSKDPSTKCGAVLVSTDKRILSTGYNGPIKGVHDSRIPLVRPEKYAHFIHAEENCILAYSGSAQDLSGSTMYVTGAPCHKCLRMIIQRGIHNIVYTKGNQTVMQMDESELNHVRLMLDYCPYVTVRIIDNLPRIVRFLHETESYIYNKNPTIVKPVT